MNPGKNENRITDIILNGTHVRMEPLGMHHLSDLCEVGLDEAVWRWIPTQIRDCGDMEEYFRVALSGKAKGDMFPFATVLQSTGKAVGSTRFGNINLNHRRVEIGWTWVAPPWQRTGVNTEAKLLMLGHAFEALGCVRVELKTDALNQRSRDAILRLGATEEGTLRQHVVTQSGRLRDTVYFSILDSEWPRVKDGLEERLQRASPTQD